MSEQVTMFPKPTVPYAPPDQAHSLVFEHAGKEYLLRVEISDGKRNLICPPGVDVKRVLSVLNKDVWAKYTLKSAFHKEVRRNDHRRGFAYARWIFRQHGPENLKKYCRGILLEETRNLALLEYIENAPDHAALEVASRLIRSVSKHDLACRRPSFAAYVAAYRVAGEQMDSTLPTDAEIESDFKSGDLNRMFRNLWIGFRRKHHLQDGKFLTRYWSVAQSIAPSLGKWGAVAAAAPWSAYDLYIAKLVSEMFAGMWTEEANELAPESSDKRLYLPEFEDYVFDNHTMEGMRLLVPNVTSIAPGVPSPHDSIDIRWSGLLRGVLWRNEARWTPPPDSGDWRNLKWEDVAISQKVWEGAKEVDGFFYEKLYTRANLNSLGNKAAP